MEMDKIYFGSARTSDEKIEELARIRQYLRSNSVDEKVRGLIETARSRIQKNEDRRRRYCED